MARHRFKKGNKFGKGGARPGSGPKPKKESREFRALLHADFEEMLAGMKRLARSRNKDVAFKARQWWCDQVIGKAPQQVKIESKTLSATLIAECDQAALAALRDLAKHPALFDEPKALPGP